jgi:3-oxoacyl-[acyl-carrier-protein] synthase II
MPVPREVVITGVGVVSPIGIGRDAFWSSLCEGRSGVGLLERFDASSLTRRIAAEVRGFDPVQYVKPRKSLKVMARDTQFGMAAAALARDDSGLHCELIDPERLGVVFAADTINPTPEAVTEIYAPCMIDGQFEFETWATRGMAGSFPLSMLKLLPNMIACHISIAHDARAHNNTLFTGEVAALLAISEAANVIRRGGADAMLTGGASSRMQPIDWVQGCLHLEMSQRADDPASACRPFDLERDGQVLGEGAAALVLEERRHAVRRGATIYGTILGTGSGCDPAQQVAPAGTGLRLAIAMALRHAQIDATALGHINAHGVATRDEDRIEAQLLTETCPRIPVTALKSYFGNLCAAGGAVEAAASVLAVQAGKIPATLNYRRPDPECPVRVITGESLEHAPSVALAVNRTRAGQAAAVIFGGA